jgi:hypothetical protein
MTLDGLLAGCWMCLGLPVGLERLGALLWGRARSSVASQGVDDASDIRADHVDIRGGFPVEFGE